MVEDFLGGMEGGVGGGHATVDGSLQQDFLNFVACYAERECGFEVHTKFRLAVQGDEHGQGEQTASLPRQAWAAPNFSPGVAGDQILKRLIELGAIF